MKPLPDSLVQRQALERAAALHRAKGVSFVNAMLDLVGPAGWADVTVPEIADQAGIHPRTATRWLVRCERDGVLRWLRPERIREKRIEAAERLRIARLVEQELIPLLRDADD